MERNQPLSLSRCKRPSQGACCCSAPVWPDWLFCESSREEFPLLRALLPALASRFLFQSSPAEDRWHRVVFVAGVFVNLILAPIHVELPRPRFCDCSFAFRGLAGLLPYGQPEVVTHRGLSPNRLGATRSEEHTT